MLGDFAFVPFLPTYITANLGLPKADLGLIYGAGGLTTLFTFLVAGRLVDRFGSFLVYGISSACAMAVLYVFFFAAPTPATLIFGIGCMVALFLFNAPRIMAAMTLFSKSVSPEQRGEFFSLQTVIQNGAVGAGSLLGAHIISGAPGEKILGMSHLLLQNWTAVIIALVLIWYLEVAVKGMKI
jgi:DHA1 family inner membrane transport protein